MRGDEASDLISDRVAQTIVDRIMRGELKAGEPIRQDALAAELGVSRIPVRDALRALEMRGLVALRANAGARVVSRTAADMDMSYRLREILEPMLLAESVPNLTDAQIEHIAAAKAQMDALEETEDYLPRSREFHVSLFSGHRSPLLAYIVNWLWDTTHSYRVVYARMSMADSERMAAMRADREQMMHAIRERDVDLACRYLAIHIVRTRHALHRYAAARPDGEASGADEEAGSPDWAESGAHA